MSISKGQTRAPESEPVASLGAGIDVDSGLSVSTFPVLKANVHVSKVDRIEIQCDQLYVLPPYSYALKLGN